MKIQVFRSFLAVSLLYLLSACSEVTPLIEKGSATQLTNELLVDAYLADDGSQSVTLSPSALRVFNNQNAKQQFFYDLQELKEPQRFVTQSGDKSILASAGHQTVHLFSAKAGQKQLSWRAKGTVENAKICAIKLNFSGSKILLGFTDGSVSVTDLSKKNQILYKPHQSDVMHLTFTPHEQSIVTASNDGQIRELSLSSGQITEQFSFDSRITAFVFGRSNGQIFAADSLSNDKFGPAQGLRLNGELDYFERNRYFRKAEFINGHPLLVTSGAKSELSLWSLKSKKEVANTHIEVRNASSTTKGIASLEQGFVTLSSDGVVQHWNLPGSK